MEEEQQATLRETLEEQVAAVRETPEPVVQADAPVIDPVEAEPKPGRTAGRARDASGKLLPGPAVKEPEVPAAEAPQPIQRPSSWKKEMWPVWDKLNTGAPLTPQEARQVAEYNAQRESQFATGVSTYKQIADTAKPLLDAIAPFQADLDRHGIKAQDMVGRLMSAHKSLSFGSPQEKLQLLGKLAHDYGIPLQALFDQNAQQQYLSTPHTPAPQQQPNIQEIVRQELANREVQQTVQSIEKDTENYPFFQYVRSTMAQLLETNEATDLNDAYHKALERPEHARLTLFSQQQQEQAEAKRKAEAAQTVARVARSNTVSPKSATPMGSPVNEKKDVRSALREAIYQHAGGARV